MDFVMRYGGRALAGLAVVVAGVLALGVFAPAPALWLSDITYPIVAIGAGLLVAIGARHRTGRSRLSWILFGIGIGLFDTSSTCLPEPSGRVGPRRPR